MEPVLVFWKAFATFKEGVVTEAIHALSTIQHKRDILFATTLAQAYYHRKCNIVDQEAVQALDAQLGSLEKTATEKAMLLAGQFLWYIGEVPKARKILKAVWICFSQTFRRLKRVEVTIKTWMPLLSRPGPILGPLRKVH